MNKGLAGLLKYAMPSLKLPKTYISLSQRMAGHMRSKFYNKQKYGPKKIDLLKIWLLIKNPHFSIILKLYQKKVIEFLTYILQTQLTNMQRRVHKTGQFGEMNIQSISEVHKTGQNVIKPDTDFIKKAKTKNGYRKLQIRNKVKV